MTGVDIRLLRFMRTRGHSPGVEKAVKALGKLGNNGAIWVVLCLLVLAFTDSNGEAWFICALLAPVAIALNYLVKLVVKRPRPVLEGLRGLPVPISVDTRRSGVMRAALAAGASMINDIDALAAPGALETVAASDCAVCLMHKQGDPATMQDAPRYADVVAEVRDFLAARIAAALAAGIARERIVADVGFGFGKTAAHNLTLLARFAEFRELGVPLAAGLSRKATLGRITGRPVDERLAASLAAALLAAQAGAKILRVHDVAETCDALALWAAVQDERT